MRVIVIPVHDPPFERQVDTNLETLQGLVDGYVEAVALDRSTTMFLNEEGKLREPPLPLNPRATALAWAAGAIDVRSDWIAGDAVMVGVNAAGDTVDCPDTYDFVLLLERPTTRPPG